MHVVWVTDSLKWFIYLLLMFMIMFSVAVVFGKFGKNKVHTFSGQFPDVHVSLYIFNYYVNICQ